MLQVITGKAGTGKTARMMQEIAALRDKYKLRLRVERYIQEK